MFKFNSFTHNLPTNTPPQNINTQSDLTKTPIIHINNLTINITPSQVVDCLKQIVQPDIYKQLPIKDREIWDDRDDLNYNYNNCRACIMPNKRLTLDIKKCNKPSPFDNYRRNKHF
jgi:hypothetical protein